MSTHSSSHSRTNAKLSPARILAPDDCVDIVALYRRVAEHSPFPIAMTAGQTHQLCGANQAFRQLLGADSLVLLGQSLIDAMPTAETKRVQGLLDLVYQTGEVAFRVDPQPILHAEPNQIAWSYSAWPIPDDKGCSVGLMLLIHDTHADHRNEQAVVDTRLINEQLLISGLREQELAEQLQHQLAFTNTITTSLSEGLYVLDIAGRCTFLNPAAELLLGWTANELYGQKMSVVIPTALLNGLHLGTTLRSDTALFMHRNGSLLPTAYSAAPMMNNKQIIGAVVTFRDMTDMQRLQRLREEYLALISHDLRSPLTVILGRAQLLIQRLTAQGLVQETQSASIIVESCLRMNQMIDDLIDSSHGSADTDAQQRSSVDLVALVQRMITQTIPPEDRTYITFDALPALEVVIEVAQIERVVVNLLTNARKFSPREYPIIVQVYQQSTDAIIAIMDHGIGITAEDLPHLFEKHYRARTVRQIEGSGLGLYSSRMIVEAHGGRLWAESTIGTGSTFRVSLPLPVEQQ